MNIENLTSLAISAFIDGGKEIMSVYNTDFGFELKKDNSPLTIADKKCNKKIEEILHDSKIPILSEEGKQLNYEDRKNWKYLWIVDPLDGTKEFIKKNGEFTVNVALVKNNQPIIGVIYVPAKNILYFSNKNVGSYKSTISIDEFKDLASIEELIRESEKLPIIKNSSKHVIVASRSHMSKETKDFVNRRREIKENIEIVSIGSSLKICMVAEGKADVYPRLAPTMEWDVAAGHSIAKYSGFKILNYDNGTELTYNKENLLNPFFVVE